MTSAWKIRPASSTVANWRSCFEPKWAYTPLLLMSSGAGEVADREALEAMDGGQ